MRLGLFGGSFDPPHRGHIEPVRAARRALGLDRVLFLPTAQPPHKPNRRFAPAFARFAMVEMALLAEEGLYASAHELTPGAPAYTIETLEHFRRDLPGAELWLLVGADSFATLHTWRRYREIVEIVRLGLLPRPGWDLDRVEREGAPEVVGTLADGRARWVPGVSIDLSSTEIRAAFSRGEDPPEGALAPLVLDYVRKYALYR